LSHLLPGALVSWLIALAVAAAAYLVSQEFFARRDVLPAGKEER